MIDQDRLFSDLMELGKIGFIEGKGLTRIALSDTDMAARTWLMERMRDAGLEVRVDPAFNVIGTLRSEKKRTDQVVAVGSHLDTVPEGGMFDGAVGVLAGLECVRSFREQGILLPWDLEVIDFSDEEGAHNAGTLGSRAMMGLLQEDEIYVSKGKEIPTFAQEMRRHGGNPERIKNAARDPSEFRAAFELHIEQGNLLDTTGTPIGVVTGIAGCYRYVVTVVGEASHAGTTPMHLRDDALVKAAPIFTLIPQWVKAQNSQMVGTVGQVILEPGATNVVPGKCQFVVELRSMNPEDMLRVRDLLTEWVEIHPGCSIKTIYEKESVRLSEDMIDLIAGAAEIENLACVRMATGAGHDSQSLAPYMPTGMIFIPCKAGKSHVPEEWTEPHQIGNGCRALMRALLELAKHENHGRSVKIPI